MKQVTKFVVMRRVAVKGLRPDQHIFRGATDSSRNLMVFETREAAEHEAFDRDKVITLSDYEFGIW